MHLGLNVNRLWFQNFYEAPSIFVSYFKFWSARTKPHATVPLMWPALVGVNIPTKTWFSYQYFTRELIAKWDYITQILEGKLLKLTNFLSVRNFLIQEYMLRWVRTYIEVLFFNSFQRIWRQLCRCEGLNIILPTEAYMELLYVICVDISPDEGFPATGSKESWMWNPTLARHLTPATRYMHARGGGKKDKGKKRLQKIFLYFYIYTV